MRIDSYSSFLDSWFSEIKKLGLEVANFSLDHLGYSTSSSAEYDQIKLEFLTVGQLFREAIVANRRVGIFKLHQPLKYKNHLIPAIELVEPKAGESSKSGFEHAEFTIDFPFGDLVKKYPHLSWDTSNINRSDFPRLKLVFANGAELKFNHCAILRS